MANALIIYYSRSGNTEKMAQIIKESIEKEGIKTELKRIEKTQVKDLLTADAIIIGSPVYYGGMAAQLKQLLDESVAHHGALDGKIGGAFSSSANIGGGNETTILDILNAFLIHGMIIQGDPMGDHYGPVSINQPDTRAEKQCARFGQRIVKLIKKLRN